MTSFAFDNEKQSPLCEVWAYELAELTALRRAASRYLLNLPAWDGAPRLEAWLEAAALRELPPAPALPSVWQQVKCLAFAWLRKSFVGGRS